MVEQAESGRILLSLSKTLTATKLRIFNSKKPMRLVNFTEISSAWLERLLWEQNVGGSNPSSPKFIPSQ